MADEHSGITLRAVKNFGWHDVLLTIVQIVKSEWLVVEGSHEIITLGAAETAGAAAAATGSSPQWMARDCAVPLHSLALESRAS